MQTSEKALDVLLEPSEGGVEVKEALYWAHQVLVPDGAECLQREIEEESLGNTGAGLENSLLEEGPEEFRTVYFEVAVDEDAVYVVVQVEGVASLQKAFELCGEEFLQFVASDRGVALDAVRVWMDERSVLDGQEYAVIFSHIQVHADGGRVGIAVEVLEVQACLENSAVLVRIGFFPDPIPVLFKAQAGVFLDEVADIVQVGGQVGFLDHVRAGEVQVVGETRMREVSLAKTVSALQYEGIL